MKYGMRLAQPVEVQLADWESRNGLQIFRSATCYDTVNVYHHTYRVLEMNAVEDEEFLYP